MRKPTGGVFRQYFAGTSVALSLFIVGCCVAWPSPAIIKITEGEGPPDIDPDHISWIVAIFDLGNILSPIPTGYLSNWCGRKMTLMLTAFVLFCTWALTIIAISPWFLFIARISGGIGKGMACTVVPTYLAEIASVQVRGAISTLFAGLFFSGVLFEYCIGPFVSYNVLNIISGVIPVMFFFTFFYLPDSPYFLIMKERHEEARKSLAWFRNTNIGDEFLEQELNEMCKIVQKEIKEQGTWSDLVASPGNRKALTIVLFLSALQRFDGVSSMMVYSAVTLPKTGGYFRPQMYMIIFGVTLVVGTFVGVYLMDRVGRKPLLIISCAPCALASAVSTVFYWAAGSTNDTDYNWIPYSCFIFYGITFSLGMGSIPTTLVGELFPTNIKSYAAAVSTIVLALSSFCVNKIYLFVKDNFGAYCIIGFFAICNTLSVIFTMLFVFETKGKTFGEIQDKLHNI